MRQPVEETISYSARSQVTDVGAMVNSERVCYKYKCVSFVTK